MSSGRYSLRRAVVDDAAGIAAVHRQAREAAYDGLAPAATLADHIGRTGEDYWRACLPAILAGDDLLAVAEAGRRPVGFVHQCGERLHRLYVSPAWWGSGIAPSLFLLARDHALASGHDRLILDAHAGNARARAFYAKLGGSESPERPDHFADGTLAPVIDIVWTLA